MPILALIAIGVGGYTLPETTSPTALIPAGIGGILAVCGLLAFKESRRKHAMHVAMLLAVVGIAGTVTALPGVWSAYEVVFQGAEPPTTEDGEPFRGPAVLARSATAVVCILLLVFGIRSVITARKQAR